MHVFFKKILFIFLLSLIIGFHLFLISKTFIVDSRGNMRAASAGYGDIPFHMTQVSKFAYEKKVDFNEPIFTGERLRYPFFINLISGLILRFGGNWHLAMQLPVMSFMASSILLMFLSYRKFLHSKFAALAAVIIFLFGSGFGTNAVIKNYEHVLDNQPKGFIEFLMDTTASTVTKWDAVYPDQNIAWGAPMSLVFLHQRSFFLGFFMFTLFWYLLTKWLKNPKNIIFTCVIGLIGGLSPLSHYHSFAAMIIVLGVLFLHALIVKNYTLARRLILLGSVIALIAIPQIIYLVQGKNGVLLSNSSFVKFRLGWMVEPTTGSVVFNPVKRFFIGDSLSFVKFLWINFGVVLPLFIVTFLISLKSSNFRGKYQGVVFLCVLALVLFVIVQIIRFQPWDYDDNKILVYFQFFAAPVLVAFFLWIKEYQKTLGIVLFAMFFLVVLHSGIIDQIPRALISYDKLPVIFNSDAVIMGNYIKADIPYNDIILTSSTHLNPVNSLAGRPVILGYPGWLWTRRISYEEREGDLKRFYSDPMSNRDIASKYGARYALLDPASVNDWEAQVSKFDQNFNLVLRQGQYSLYYIQY